MTDISTAPSVSSPTVSGRTASNVAVSADVLRDPRSVYRRTSELTLGVITAVRPDQLELPTSCGDMNVERMLGHLVLVFQRVADLGRGTPIEFVDQVVTSEDWAADAAAVAADSIAAWADAARLEAEIVLPWTTDTGAAVLATYVAEALIHTWDLATATGQHPVWDDEACALGLAAMRHELPVADRTPMWEAFAAGSTDVPEGFVFSPPFANAVSVPDDAPPIDQLVAWSGRQP